MVPEDHIAIPESVTHVLDKGPKYSHEPSIPAHELLALDRHLSKKATSEDQERCLLEGVDALGGAANKVVTGKTGKSRNPTRTVVTFSKKMAFNFYSLTRKVTLWFSRQVCIMTRHNKR